MLTVSLIVILVNIRGPKSHYGKHKNIFTSYFTSTHHHFPFLPPKGFRIKRRGKNKKESYKEKEQKQTVSRCPYSSRGWQSETWTSQFRNHDFTSFFLRSNSPSTRKKKYSKRKLSWTGELFTGKVPSSVSFINPPQSNRPYFATLSPPPSPWSRSCSSLFPSYDNVTVWSILISFIFFWLLVLIYIYIYARI